MAKFHYADFPVASATNPVTSPLVQTLYFSRLPRPGKFWGSRPNGVWAKAAIIIAIRLRFDYDWTTTIAIKITIRLRFDSSKWEVGIMTVCSWRHKFIPDDILLRKCVKRLYQRWQSKDAIPSVHPSAWMPFLLPWRALLRHYVPRPLPSYWLRRLSTQRKNEHVHFSS